MDTDRAAHITFLDTGRQDGIVRRMKYPVSSANDDRENDDLPKFGGKAHQHKARADQQQPNQQSHSAAEAVDHDAEWNLGNPCRHVSSRHGRSQCYKVDLKLGS